MITSELEQFVLVTVTDNDVERCGLRHRRPFSPSADKRARLKMQQLVGGQRSRRPLQSPQGPREHPRRRGERGRLLLREVHDDPSAPPERRRFEALRRRLLREVGRLLPSLLLLLLLLHLLLRDRGLGSPATLASSTAVVVRVVVVIVQKEREQRADEEVGRIERPVRATALRRPSPVLLVALRLVKGRLLAGPAELRLRR